MGYQPETFNTNEIDKHGPPALPLDVYQCEISKAEAGDSKSSGNPMLTIWLDPLCNVDGEEVKGRFKDFLTFTQGAIFKTKQILEAAGLEVEELRNDVEFREQLGEALVGCKLWATLGPQPAADGSGREFTGVIVYLTEEEVEEAVAKLRASNGKGVIAARAEANKTNGNPIRRRGS
jgi:hypothetical protein